MRDPNPPRKVNTCAFCGPGITHIINPINYPNDMYANSDRAKGILEERRLKAEEDRRFKQRDVDIRKFVRR